MARKKKSEGIGGAIVSIMIIAIVFYGISHYMETSSEQAECDRLLAEYDSHIDNFNSQQYAMNDIMDEFMRIQNNIVDDYQYRQQIDSNDLYDLNLKIKEFDNGLTEFKNIQNEFNIWYDENGESIDGCFVESTSKSEIDAIYYDYLGSYENTKDIMEDSYDSLVEAREQLIQYGTLIDLFTMVLL